MKRVEWGRGLHHLEGQVSESSRASGAEYQPSQSVKCRNIFRSKRESFRFIPLIVGACFY